MKYDIIKIDNKKLFFKNTGVKVVEFNKVGFEEIDQKSFVVWAITLRENGQRKNYGVGLQLYAELSIQDIFKVKGLQQEINDKLQPAKTLRDTKYYQVALRCNKLLLVFLPSAEEQMSGKLLGAVCDLIELQMKNS